MKGGFESQTASPLSMSSDQLRFFPAHMQTFLFSAVVSICKNAHIRS